MKIGSMFRDVISAVFQPPATQRYPFERTPAPARLRGKLVWSGEKCTGCTLCTKDCPANAIEMVVNEKQTKTFVMRYYVHRCIFCAQCVQNCRMNCLSMSNEEWELAALSTEPFTLYYGDPERIEALHKAAEAPEAIDQECPDHEPASGQSA